MNLHRISAVGVSLFLGVGLVTGCQASASLSVGPDVGGCSHDDSLGCSDGSYGYSCASGDNPENYDNLSCSVPTVDAGGNYDYCCFTGFSGDSSTCVADDTISQYCSAGTYGFQCAAGDDPTTLDSTLNCSSPTPDGSYDDFCCAYGGTYSGSSSGGTGACGLDSTVDCAGGGDGYSCPAGDNPENYDSTLSCSDPTANGPDDDFCCIAWSGTASTCAPDDSVTAACPDPDSYGYSCAAGDDPTSLDPSLNCSSPTPDGANDDFCCTL